MVFVVGDVVGRAFSTNVSGSVEVLVFILMLLSIFCYVCVLVFGAVLWLVLLLLLHVLEWISWLLLVVALSVVVLQWLRQFFVLQYH